jgi:hypothetical protein
MGKSKKGKRTRDADEVQPTKADDVSGPSRARPSPAAPHTPTQPAHLSATPEDMHFEDPFEDEIEDDVMNDEDEAMGEGGEEEEEEDTGAGSEKVRACLARFACLANV